MNQHKLSSLQVSFIILILTIVTDEVKAAIWSSSKVEVLYGQDFARGPNGSDQDESTFTFANASGFKWGDTFIFADVNKTNDRDNTGGTHLEFSTRYRMWKPEADGAIKGIYVIGQADMTSNAFVQKIVPMFGFSLDWSIPGFKFFKSHLQYRNDPTKSGSALQFNLVWNAPFTIGEHNFTFEGFADFTQSEGVGFGSENNLLMQPQLLWHVNKNLALGIEYQYWKNRLGIKGRNESVPQILLRWTF